MAEKAKAYDARASHAFEEGTKARERGDKYLRNTVLLATVLFLTALAQKFKVHAAGPPCSVCQRFCSQSASISSPRTRRPDAAHAAGGGVPAAAASPPGAGAVSATDTLRGDRASVVRYAVTTPTMISGATPSPAFDVSKSATTTDDSGSRRIDTTAAPIKTATPGVSEYPGR
jgi:hypothetical protein